MKIDKAMRIPRAKKAVNDEWEALEQLLAWDIKTARPRAEVEAEAIRKKKKFHFGSLMDLCHEKHSEKNLPDAERFTREE